jgi:hypothetical protein
MSIPTIHYKGFELRGYAEQMFPTHHDPFAKGDRRFSSVVRIQSPAAQGNTTRRYETLFKSGYSAGPPVRREHH